MYTQGLLGLKPKDNMVYVDEKIQGKLDIDSILQNVKLVLAKKELCGVCKGFLNILVYREEREEREERYDVIKLLASCPKCKKDRWQIRFRDEEFMLRKAQLKVVK